MSLMTSLILGGSYLSLHFGSAGVEISDMLWHHFKKNCWNFPLYLHICVNFYIITFGNFFLLFISTIFVY